jgi:hypothetical protein
VSEIERLGNLPAPDQHRALLNLITTHIAGVTDHPSHAVDPGRPLHEMGMDSLMALELRNRLAAATGLTLPATLVFDHPTAAALGRRLQQLLFPNGGNGNGHVGRVGNGGSAGQDAAIRQALASIPLDRLRAAGLMEQLLALSGDTPAVRATAGEQTADDINAMAADDLIRLALDDDFSDAGSD